MDDLTLFISKWLKLAKGYGIKIVNPCGSEAWGWGKNVDGLDDPEPHWNVTGREVITSLVKVNERLGLPHSVHVHTNDPGLAIQKGLTFGSLTKMKIDNMREEHQERLIMEAEKQAAAAKEEAAKEEMPHKDAGFISVSVGEGVNEIFKGLGVDYIIEGGQTMNPSTEDILNAIDKVNADVVYVLPNNKNIILAANQAESLVEDKKVVVIPSKTVPQGITALINFIPDCSVEENVERMTAEMSRVKTGQVTYAVRDTELDGKVIKENDIMGIGDQGIVAVGQDIADTTVEMIMELVDDESELISIYYGADVTEEDAEAIAEKVSEVCSGVEVEVNYGGQPIYYYLVSIE
jgi:DAK2 domain fusion protein YloV